MKQYQDIYMGTYCPTQKRKCLTKPKDYTAISEKTGGNFGLTVRSTAALYKRSFRRLFVRVIAEVNATSNRLPKFRVACGESFRAPHAAGDQPVLE